MREKCDILRNRMEQLEFLNTHWPYWGEDCHTIDFDWNQAMHTQNQLVKINIRNADKELEMLGKPGEQEKHWYKTIYL